MMLRMERWREFREEAWDPERAGRPVSAFGNGVW